MDRYCRETCALFPTFSALSFLIIVFGLGDFTAARLMGNLTAPVWVKHLTAARWVEDLTPSK